MKISVIIPALNEESQIGVTIQSLFNQTLKPHEIIIADAGSTDKTLIIATGFSTDDLKISSVHNNKKLPGAGRNAGAAVAEGDFLAFIDAGSIAQENWLEELAKPFQEDREVEVVYGRFIPQPDNYFEKSVTAVIYQGLYSFSDKIIAVRSSNEKGVLFSGSSILIKAETFKQIGGFPEWLRTSEDKLFGLKLLHSGKQVAFNPRAYIHNHLRRSLPEIYRQAIQYGKGNGISNQIPSGFKHVLMKYITGLILLVLSFRYPLLLVALAPLPFYIHKRGYMPYKKIFGHYPLGKSFFFIPFLIFFWEISKIIGHIIGIVQYMTVARHKKMLEGYLASGQGQKS